MNTFRIVLIVLLTNITLISGIVAADIYVNYERVQVCIFQQDNLSKHQPASASWADSLVLPLAGIIHDSMCPQRFQAYMKFGEILRTVEYLSYYESMVSLEMERIPGDLELRYQPAPEPIIR